jgi:hypothetical protein
MAFFKDNLSIALMTFLVIVLVLQSIGVYIAWDDDDKTSWLIYNKYFYIFYLLMALWCHVKATITDPGTINHENNVHVLELYINHHRHCVKNAQNFNFRFREVLEKQMKENEGKDSESENDQFDWGYQYEIHSQIRDYHIEQITKEYKMRFTRCKKCLVVRPSRGHHCTRCKKLINFK